MTTNGKRTFGWLKLLAIILILLVGALIALPLLFDANQFRPRLETEIATALGREVKIGNLKLSLLSGGVAADEISISDDPAFGSEPFVRAKSLRVGVELQPLIFSRSVRVTGIRLEQPEINLIRSPEGAWNFSSFGQSKRNRPERAAEARDGNTPGTPVTVGELEVTDGRVTVLRAGKRAKPHLYQKVNIKARDLSFDSAFPFSLTALLPAGGSVKVDGKAGPVNPSDASLTPVSATIDLSRLDLIASGFIQPDSGLAGVLDFSGSLTSDGRQLQSKGAAKGEKLQIVRGGAPASRPVLLNYVLTHDLRAQTGALHDTRVEFGKAAAHLDGTYDLRGDEAQVRLRLRGTNMPAEDLEALLPAIAVTLPKGAALQGGMLNADLSAAGPLDRLITTGNLDIQGTRLAGFDLGSKMATVTSLAGIQSNAITEIEKFASAMRVAPEGIEMSGLTLVVPAIGVLTGSGSVGSNSALDFKMTARLNVSKGVLGGLSRIAGVTAGNEISVPFFIRGTTANPSFVPDAKGAAQSLLNSALAPKGSTTGDAGSAQKLGDTLRGLFGKKKK